MLGFFSNLQNIVVSIAVALVVGFGGGYYTKAQFFKAGQTDALVEARKVTAEDIVVAHKTDIKVEAKVETVKQEVSTVRKALAARAQTQEIKNEVATQGKPAVCVWTLDVGSLSLLNSARTGIPTDASLLGDAAGKAPSGVTTAEVLDSDAEIAGLYRELAERHNALVDYEEEQLRRQAGK